MKSTKPSSLPEAPLLIARKRAAELLAISVQTLDKLIRGGQLRACRIGRSVKIFRDSLLAYMEKQQIKL